MNHHSVKRDSRIGAAKRGSYIRPMHSLTRIRIDKDTPPPPVPEELKRRVRMVMETRKFVRRHHSAPLSVEMEETKMMPTHRNFLKAHLKEQFREDLFVGGERARRVLPECHLSSTTNEDERSVEDKIDAVLADPKFGMFSLFKYHWQRGYRNEELVRRNVVYCSHIFSLWTALPLVVFFSQWIMYVALVSDQWKHYEGGYCPNRSSLENKLLMTGVSLVYFVKSFFLWDNLVDRTRCKKMIPSTSYLVILDSLQEFGFNLLVYGANLWLVFSETDIINALLDSLAMEFLMVLDNQFMEMYISYLPGVAVDIYDNVFVTQSENKRLIMKKMNESCCFYWSKKLTYIPFKILQFATMIFPIFCAVMAIYGAICK